MSANRSIGNRWLTALAALLCLAGSTAAGAGDPAAAAGSRDAATGAIRLPAEAAPEARENGDYGVDEANEARAQEREYGDDRAERGGDNRRSGAASR